MTDAKRQPKLRKDGQPKRSGGAHNPKGGPNMQVAVLDPDVSHRTTAMAMAIMGMGEIDLNDGDALADRLGEYFQLCSDNAIKPTMSGLALSIGVNRQELLRIRDGSYETVTSSRGMWTTSKVRHLSRDSASLIKKACELMEVMWEANFQEGSIQPVVGIFLGKNNYGYKDQVDTVVTAKQESTIDDAEAKAIVEKYRESLPEPEAPSE